MNRITFNYCAKCTCHKTSKVRFYNRTYTNSQHITDGFPTATGVNEGGIPITDTNPSSNHSPASVETAQARNLNTADPDPDKLIFEGALLSPVVDDEAWMAFIIKKASDFPSVVMSLLSTDIVSPRNDNQDYQYDETNLLSMNISGITDGPLFIILKVPHSYDKNSMKASSYNYFDFSDTEPSLSDTEKCVDYIEELTSIYPDLNCEGETHDAQSIG